MRSALCTFVAPCRLFGRPELQYPVAPPALYNGPFFRTAAFPQHSSLLSPPLPHHSSNSVPQCKHTTYRSSLAARPPFLSPFLAPDIVLRQSEICTKLASPAVHQHASDRIKRCRSVAGLVATRVRCHRPGHTSTCVPTTAGVKGSDIATSQFDQRRQPTVCRSAWQCSVVLRSAKERRSSCE